MRAAGVSDDDWNPARLRLDDRTHRKLHAAGEEQHIARRQGARHLVLRLQAEKDRVRTARAKFGLHRAVANDDEAMRGAPRTELPRNMGQ